MLLRENLLECLLFPFLKCQPPDSLPLVNSPLHLNMVISKVFLNKVCQGLEGQQFGGQAGYRPVARAPEGRGG